MIRAPRAAARRVPRKAPNRNPTGVRTSDRSTLRADRAGDDVGRAADHDGDEGRRDELLAHEGRDRGGRGEERAAESGEPGAEAECEHVDPVSVDAERPRHRRRSASWPAPAGRIRCGCRATTEPRSRARRRRQAQANRPRTNTGRRRSTARDLDRRHERPEQQQHALRQDQADAPGDDQRAELSPVEPPDDQPLQNGAEHCRPRRRPRSPRAETATPRWNRIVAV